VNAFGLNRDVLVLALARMADALGNSFLIIVLPLYIASGQVTGGAFGLSEAAITGVVLSMFGLLNSIIQPFTGRLSDRVGKRKVFVLVGLVILSITNFAFSLVGGYVSLIVIRAIQGIGVAFTIPATVALVNELATTADRGGNMGAFNTFRLIGFGIGPLVAGSVVEFGPYDLSLGGLTLGMSGFEAAFYVATVAAALSILLVWVFVSDPPDLQANAGGDLSISVRSAKPGRLLDPIFTLGVGAFFMVIGIALLATLQETINARLDQGATLFSLQFAAFVGAQVLFQTPIGRASDRFGRKPFVVWGLILFAPLTLVQGLVPLPVVEGVLSGSWQLVLARFLQGVAGAMVLAPGFALAGDLAGTGESGSKLAVLTMAFGLGTAIGPLSSGFLVAYGFVVPFAFGAVLALLAAILVATQVEETVGQASPETGESVAAGTD
jgi:MFS family permease